jgi:hypothetical protein
MVVYIVSYNNDVVGVYGTLEKATADIQELFYESPVTITRVDTYYESYTSSVGHEIEARIVDLRYTKTLPTGEEIPNQVYTGELGSVYIVIYDETIIGVYADEATAIRTIENDIKETLILKAHNGNIKTFSDDHRIESYSIKG